MDPIYRYTLFGISVFARSHLEALGKFNEKNFVSYKELELFMRELGTRVKFYSNTRVRTGHIDEFMEDMVQCGVMQIEPTTR